jgi:broad specificity phosphatase PhoE
MSRRVFACLDRLVAARPACAVVVTHANSGSAVIRWWLGLSEDNRELVEFELGFCSLSELAVNEWGEHAVVRLNDTSHLLPAPSGDQGA